jgi:hypothetical protein
MVAIVSRTGPVGNVKNLTIIPGFGLLPSPPWAARVAYAFYFITFLLCFSASPLFRCLRFATCNYSIFIVFCMYARVLIKTLPRLSFASCLAPTRTVQKKVFRLKLKFCATCDCRNSNYSKTSKAFALVLVDLFLNDQLI